MEKTEKNKLILALQILYFIVCVIVVFGEFQEDKDILSVSRPFILPVLAIIYFLSSEKRNYLYLLALFFGWLANIFFISVDESGILRGGISYLIFWVLITYIVLVNTRFPVSKLFIIAIIPFLFIYCYVLQLIYVNIYGSVYLYFSNAVFMIFLGGYSLSAYIMHSSRINTHLLIAALLFTMIQFIISIDLYYMSMNIFRPMAFVMFTAGQFVLYKMMLLFDEKRLRLNDNTSS
ncbi:hypothetical protein [Flavobacterium sp.]|uniref:hypothetical protein n=1 Tax=Flavobacterium sp. TaxID=239 RepID=UPI0028BDCBF7|nr:hypothetical protein [Flavobacterium sp.]